MLNVILALVLINGGGGGGGGLPQLGDTLTVYVNDFRLILGRHAEVAQVRGITDEAYILAPYETHPISGLANYKNYLMANEMGTLNYYYSSDYGLSWNGAGYVSTPSKHAIIDSVLYGVTGYLMTFIGGRDTIVFTLGIGGSPTVIEHIGLGQIYDLFEVYLSSTPRIDSILFYAATDSGVFAIYSHLAPPLWRFEQVGDLAGPVYSVAFFDNCVFAGLENGVQVWDGNAWSALDGVTGTVNDIEVSDDGVLFATTAGLFKYDGSSVSQLLEGYVNDVAALGNSYVAVVDSGVERSDDGGANWDTQEVLAAAYSVVAIPDEGTFALGTELGVYKWDENASAWLNVSKGIGNLLSDIEISNLCNASLGFEQVLLDTLGIQESDLYDVDGDSKYYVYVTPLTISSSVSVTFIPGYFDPTDEDTTAEMSNRKEIFVLNRTQLGSMLDDPDALRPFLAYLYAKYVAWSLDPDETAWQLAGLGMIGAYLSTGVDLKAGFDGNSSFEANPNQYLFHYPLDWRPTPVVSDGDRDRLFLLYAYLYDRFGLDIIRELYTDQANGLSSIEMKLKLREVELSDFFIEWNLANFLDDTSTVYGYRCLDVHVQPVEFQPDGATYGLWPYGALFVEYTGSDSTPFVVNGEDNVNFYAYSIVNGTVTEETLDEKNRFRSIVDSGYVFVLMHQTLSYLNAFISADTTPPEGIDLFVIQNPTMPNLVDAFFAIEGEMVYSDVNVAMPTLLAISDGDTTSYLLSSYTSDDKYFYHGMITFDVPGGTEKTLTLVMDYQDRSGNETIAHEKTLTIRRFSSVGGVLALNGGRFSIEIPAGAVSTSMLVVAATNEPVGLIDGDGYGLSPLYAVGNGNMVLNADAKVMIKLDDDVHGAVAAIYKWDGHNWVALQTEYDPVSKKLTAYTDRLGIFQVRRGDGTTTHYAFGFRVVNRVTKGAPVTVEYSLPREASVSIKIFDCSGRAVRTLLDARVGAGKQIATWDLRDDFGRAVSSGVYFVKMNAGEFRTTKKLVVLK